jgi:hypothetical protein
MTTIIPATPDIRARVHFPNEAGGFTIFMCRVVAWLGIPDHRDRSFRAIVTADSDAS